MTVRIEWLNHRKKALRFVFEGEWTVDEWMTEIKGLHEKMDTLDYKVPAVVDYQAGLYFPRNVVARIPEMTAGMKHPNGGGLLIFVGLSGFTQLIAGIFSKTYLPVRFAESMAVAEEWVEEYLHQIGAAE